MRTCYDLNTLVKSLHGLDTHLGCKVNRCFFRSPLHTYVYTYNHKIYIGVVSHSQTPQFFPFSWGRGKERVWSTPVERFVLSAPIFRCTLIDHHLVCQCTLYIHTIGVQCTLYIHYRCPVYPIHTL